MHCSVCLYLLTVWWFILVACEEPIRKEKSDRPRIVGGVLTTIESFPFNVQLFNMGGMCSGSILTSMTVLTAAHCFQFNTDPSQMQIFSGAQFVYDRDATAHDISEFIMHEKYNIPYQYSNDIAIILIADEFKYSKIVRKARLAISTAWMKDKHTPLVVSGWGKTDYHQKAGKNTKLMKANLKFLKLEDCEIANNVTLQNDMVCLFGNAKRDACQGDSGSGVLYKSLIVAIVSHGRGCAELPSMYTNVFHFRRWIQNTVDKLHRKHCADEIRRKDDDNADYQI